MLVAYREANVPLSYQTASDWYSTGGRYWRRVWAVCGYLKQGDRFFGTESLAWADPLPDYAGFWADMTALAADSDAWQLAQGQDVPPPKVDTAALVHRTASWREVLTTRWGFMGGKPDPTTARRLVAVLKEAAKKLDEWYKRRFPGRPPLPPPMPSGDGAILIAALVGLALLGGVRRRPTSRRRR